LEYIEEGIITIGRGFRVEASLSPYIDQLIERQPNPKGHEDVFHLLMSKADISATDKQLVHDTLEACMGSTLLTWDLNHTHLPLEITINQGSKILALDWRPILGRHQTIDRILLVLRDHSLRRQLEKQISHEQDRLLQSTVQLQEILRARPQHVRRVIRGIMDKQASIQQLRDTGEWTQLARILHTLKGDARTLGLPTLVSQTHALESSPQKAELWVHWVEHIQQYHKILENFEQTDDSQRSLHGLAQEILEGLKPLLEKHQLFLQRFAVDDAWGADATIDFEGLRTILLHSLTNAIDHGFVIPAQTRSFTRKQVEISVQAVRKGSTLHLSISDNGAGIERETLAKKYGKGIPLSDEDVTALILQAGVSSAPQLTETSGRGMGLNAVQSILQDWMGTVRLVSGRETGTRLELQWTETKSRPQMQSAT
jgi:signal transduction histidine kinase